MNFKKNGILNAFSGDRATWAMLASPPCPSGHNSSPTPCCTAQSSDIVLEYSQTSDSTIAEGKLLKYSLEIL